MILKMIVVKLMKILDKSERNERNKKHQMRASDGQSSRIDSYEAMSLTFSYLGNQPLICLPSMGTLTVKLYGFWNQT